MSTISRCSLGGATSVAVLSALAGSARGQMSDQELRQKALQERVEALEAKVNAPDTFRAYWKDKLTFETGDKNVEFKLGGFLQFDSEWNHVDNDLETSKKFATAGNTGTATAVGKFEDGWEVRRARLNMLGTLYKHVEFKIQFELAKGATADKDVYGGLYDLGDWIPNIRAGQMFEPFGLDEQTRDTDLTFIEFDPISDTFAPGRSPGVALMKNWKVDNTPRFTWEAGLFRADAADNGVGTGDAAYDLAGRVTGTPVWQADGKEMVHVGLGVVHRTITRTSTGHGVTLSSKPVSDQLPTVISTGTIPADEEWKYDLELGTVWNRFSVLAEYMMDRVKVASSSTLKDPTLKGWYAQVAYALTGEPRRYDAVNGWFTSPKPAANAFVNGGMGAWEVALRYSSLDLTDGDTATNHVEGGKLHEIGAALNWYLNPNTRVMFDLARVSVDVDNATLRNGHGKSNDATVGEVRVQVNF